jgi:phosphoglycolate phosphatase
VSSPNRLVLWDIDRTLVEMGGLGREIYAAAFDAVVGFPPRHLPNMAGRTDHDIILTSLGAHGIEGAEQRLEEFYAALAAATEARKAEIGLRGRGLPGAHDVVGRLAALPGVVQTVVTGNIRPTARLKLAAFDLAGAMDFDIGGYGSDDRDRAHLVRLAVERAGRKYGERWAPERVCVIGDTVHDIAGARANGVRAIGVATGSSTFGELELAGADLVLKTLADSAELVRLVLG